MDKSLDQLAVLFADVCDSTRLYEEYGDEIARADLGACIEFLGEICTGLSGETIKTIGDEIMCAFDDPVNAALAATEMQAALRKVCNDGQFRMGTLHIKIGWHYGDVIWRGGELIGEAPIAAQQVISRAQADEILTSSKSIDALPAGMFPGVHSIDRVDAEAWEGEMEICKIPWEQTGEETQISPVSTSQLMPDRAELVLEYDGVKFCIDATRTRCSIGRGRHVDLRVNGSFTSRQHAEITYRNGRFNIRDESVNGIVIVNDDGTVKRLRREEGVLQGSGVIGFGAPPDDDPPCRVAYKCD